MYRFKRLLVGLEMDSTDEATIRYAAKVSRMAHSEKIYFIHVASSLEVPDSIKEAYPDVVEPVDESVKNEMRDLVKNNFEDGHPDTALAFEVLEGNPLTELLRRTRQKMIDLVILGKKRDATRTVLPEKIARKAPCSILIIPEGSEARITKALIPTDFSECAADATEVAIAFASTARNNPPLHCLHVYNVPMGYYKTGKTYEEFAKLMEQLAEKSYDSFIEKIDSKGVDIYPTFELNSNVVNTIETTVANERIDFVALGVRGKSSTAAVLLGGTTEKIIQQLQVPLIVVKRKGAGMSLVDALLQL